MQEPLPLFIEVRRSHAKGLQASWHDSAMAVRRLHLQALEHSIKALSDIGLRRTRRD
jgi:hypothetical protein